MTNPFRSMWITGPSSSSTDDLGEILDVCGLRNHRGPTRRPLASLLGDHRQTDEGTDCVSLAIRPHQRLRAAHVVRKTGLELLIVRGGSALFYRASMVVHSILARRLSLGFFEPNVAPLFTNSGILVLSFGILLIRMPKLRGGWVMPSLPARNSVPFRPIATLFTLSS